MNLWTQVITWAQERGAPETLLGMMRARDALGKARYLEPLTHESGVDGGYEATQELLDALVYFELEGVQARRYGDQRRAEMAKSGQIAILSYLLVRYGQPELEVVGG